VAILVIAAGARLGFWFVPFIVGAALGLTARWRRRRIVATVAAVAVAGWAIPLAWPALQGMPVAATARTTAALAGLPASAGLMLAVTLLLGVIQAFAGVWLARAVVGPRRKDAPGQPQPSEAGQLHEGEAPAHGFRSWVIIWSGQFASMVGSSLTNFGLAVYVFGSTGSATKLGIILAFGLLPGIVASPFAGSLVDRWGTRRSLLVSNVGCMLVTLTLVLLLVTHTFEVWQVYIIVVATSLLGSLQVPATGALTPQLVARDQLARANGMRMVGLAVSQVLAPVTAGFLLVTIHLAGIVTIDLLSFAAANITLLVLHVPRVRPQSAEGDGNMTLLAEFREGWHYVVARPGLRALLFFLAAINFSAGFIELLIMPLVLSFTSSKGLGSIMSIGGIGMIVAAVWINVAGGPRRRVRGLFGFALLFAVAVIAGATRPDVLLIACAAFVAMGALIVVNTTHQNIWQTKVELHLMGRVMALLTMIVLIPQLLGNILAGLAADRIFEPLVGRNEVRSKNLAVLIGNGPGRGIALLMILVGLLIIITVAVGSRSRRLRNLEDELPDVPAKTDTDAAIFNALRVRRASAR
jgi:MFS transporter, DHA3 family, macrolide efflux protein